jgi:DNA invertase Pin-like site-specific DNA recombinase
MKSLSRLTAEDLKQIVEEAVEKKLYEFVQDPDKGLRLKPDVRKRLRRTLAAERTSKKGIPASQVAKKLGLRW